MWAATFDSLGIARSGYSIGPNNEFSQHQPPHSYSTLIALLKQSGQQRSPVLRRTVVLFLTAASLLIAKTHTSI